MNYKKRVTEKPIITLIRVIKLNSHRDNWLVADMRQREAVYANQFNFVIFFTYYFHSIAI